MLPYRGPGIIVCYAKYFYHVAKFHVVVVVVVVAPQATLSEWVLLLLINVNCGLPLRPILTAGDWLEGPYQSRGAWHLLLCLPECGQRERSHEEEEGEEVEEAVVEEVAATRKAIANWCQGCRETQSPQSTIHSPQSTVHSPQSKP